MRSTATALHARRAGRMERIAARICGGPLHGSESEYPPRIDAAASAMLLETHTVETALSLPLDYGKEWCVCLSWCAIAREICAHVCLDTRLFPLLRFHPAMKTCADSFLKHRR